MTLEELKETISAQGLLPIPVEGDADKEGSSIPIFAGTLENYLKTSKILEAKAILIFSNKFSKNDFIIEFNGEDEFTDDSNRNLLDEGEIDLTKVEPALSIYKSHIDKHYAFLLSTVGVSTGLRFYFEENWYSEFSEKCYKVIEKVESYREASLERSRQKGIKEEKELIEKLWELKNDKKFINIYTQLSMKKYALEKLPEIKKLRSSTLINEISEIDNELKKEGLKKRKY